MLRLEILPGTNEAFSRSASRRRLVNWYPNINQDTQKINLYPMPGYDLLATHTSAVWRGAAEFGGVGYAVIGTNLVSITSSGIATNLNTTLTGPQARVDMAVGKTQIMIVDGNQGYVYTPSTDTFAVISDANFPANPTTCAHLDGYFIVDDPSNPGRWYRSQQNDATDWTIGASAEFATAERSGDTLKRIKESGDRLWFIGAQLTEAWFNASDPNVIFNRINAISLDWGTEAPFTAVEADNNLIFLAKNERNTGRVILVNQSGQLKTLSPDWLETLIAGYTVRTDAFSFMFDWQGHTLYVLTFPTEDKTWVLDLNAQAWFEWKNFDLGRHRANGFLLLNGKALIGDYVNGNIYQLKSTVYTHNGDMIEHIFRSDHINQDNISLRYDVIEPVFERGVGIGGTGQGSDPLCQLRWSKDSGNTWSNQEYKAVGKIGEYESRTLFRNKGWAKTMTLELSISEPVKAVLESMYAQVSLGEARPDTI